MNILCQLISINYENLEAHFWSFWQTKIFQIQPYIWCLSSFLFPQYCRSWPSPPQRAWPFVICLYGLSPFQNVLFSIYNFSNRNPFSIENDELKFCSLTIATWHKSIWVYASTLLLYINLRNGLITHDPWKRFFLLWLLGFKWNMNPLRIKRRDMINQNVCQFPNYDRNEILDTHNYYLTSQ